MRINPQAVKAAYSELSQKVNLKESRQNQADFSKFMEKFERPGINQVKEQLKSDVSDLKDLKELLSTQKEVHELHFKTSLALKVGEAATGLVRRLQQGA